MIVAPLLIAKPLMVLVRGVLCITIGLTVVERLERLGLGGLSVLLRRGSSVIAVELLWLGLLMMVMSVGESVRGRQVAGHVEGVWVVFAVLAARAGGGRVQAGVLGLRSRADSGMKFPVINAAAGSVDHAA